MLKLQNGWICTVQRRGRSWKSSRRPETPLTEQGTEESGGSAPPQLSKKHEGKAAMKLSQKLQNLGLRSRCEQTHYAPGVRHGSLIVLFFPNSYASVWRINSIVNKEMNKYNSIRGTTMRSQTRDGERLLVWEREATFSESSIVFFHALLGQGYFRSPGTSSRSSTPLNGSYPAVLQF